MTNRLTACALAALLAGSVSVHAGGLPEDDGGSLKDTGYTAPSPIWTGFYVGVHAGYADGEWDGDTLWEGGYDGIDEDTTIDGQGHFIGGQAGYNFKRGQIVVGIEGDLSATNFDGSGTFTAYGDDGGNAWRKKHDLELDYFGTARARVGYDIDGVMPYVTGGFAWGETSGDLAVTQYDEATLVEAGTSYANVEETHTGWTVGGGIESLVNRNWSFKAEYLYVDLGKEDYLFKGKTFTGADFETDSYESDLNFHTFRLGINYHFD